MDRIEMVQELWHAWNTGIHDRVLEYLAEDAIVRPLEATFVTYHGLEQLDLLRIELSERGIEVQSTPFRWEELQDDVIVSGRSRVTRSGTSEDFKLSWLFRFDGDKVVLIQTFPNYEAARSFHEEVP